jgi:hypothetical protein
MTGISSKRRRGASPEDARAHSTRRRRWLVALVGCGLLAGAIAVALAVRNETCDVGETLNPEDRAIICAMRDRDQGECPSPEVLSPEECQRFLDQFEDKHGKG